MKLTLVKKDIEAQSTYSFFFKPDQELSWKSGQYLYLTLNEISKPFTISSITSEKLIRITTRVREDSTFKQNLSKVEIGQEIDARGPFGSYVFDNNDFNNLNLFIAGGIGITPFRSMIANKHVTQNSKNPLYLLYSNSNSEFVFKNELDDWSKSNDLLKVAYYDSSLNGHLNKDKLVAYLRNWNLDVKNVVFWVVGPTPFVNALEDILESLEVDSDKIKTEKFIGY